MTLAVANTIRTQLGANRFEAMTGAKNWVGDKNSVQFDIGRNGSKANKVKVELDGNDEYKVSFFKYSTPGFTKSGELKGGLSTLKVIEGVQVSNLREVFTAFTGLKTSL